MRNSPLAWLALALLAVHLGVTLPRALRRSVLEIRNLVEVRHQTPFEKRARNFTPGYVQAIERIRREIPPDGAYLLINAHPDFEEGGPLWIKFDLAPRRAVYLGKLDEIGNARRLRRRMPRAARWVILARGPYEPPVLIERHRFLRELEARTGG